MNIIKMKKNTIPDCFAIQTITNVYIQNDVIRLKNSYLWIIKRSVINIIWKCKKNIPSGSNFVQTYRPNKKGELYLYVVANDKIEKIPSKLKELNQNYVYLKKRIDGYEVSLTPFEKVTTTRTYNKKKTNAYEN